MKRIITSFFVLFLASQNLAAQGMTRKQQNSADQLVSLVSRGSTLSVLKSAIKLQQRANLQQIDGIDEYLSKHDVPPLTELTANTRFALVLQGYAKSLPKPSEQETLLSIPIFEARSKDAVAFFKKHPLMQKTLPIFDSLESYQDLFWDIHVLENQMQNAYRTAIYGQQMVKFAERFSAKAPEQATDEYDFGKTARTLKRWSKELTERKIELRLDRLQLAGELLHDSDEFRPRLFAARAVDTDGELLTEFFDARKQQTFARERLNEPELALILADEIDQLREQAGDLLEKSRLFASGLHWWQRGRYGRGSEGNGMLKPAAAASSPQAAFGLYMPAETPVPTDPYEIAGQPTPQLSRRHHYAWMYEYRRVGSSVSTFSDPPTTSQTRLTSKTTLGYFW